MNRERLRKIGRKLLAAFIGIAISFLLAECSLRIIGIGAPVFQRPDGTYGNVHIPGATGWWTAEGHSYVTINGDGLRDVDHKKDKPADTLRIAVLGDSYTEAFQVPLKQSFWWQLGEKLGDCPAVGGRKVEMVNFGVSGYGTAQELLTLQKRVWDYHPDVVLLAFLTGNDVSDNSGELAAPAAPFYRYEGDELVLDSSRARSLGTGGEMALWMVRHSRVLQLANAMRINLATCGKLAGCGEDPDVKKGEQGMLNGVYLEPTDDKWRDAWRVTEELLRRVRDDVASHGAQFFLVTLSNAIQVHPDADTREAFRAAIGAPDLFYPDHRIQAFAQREGINELMLAPTMLETAEAEHRYLHGWKGKGLGTGHWNEDGHRVAAELMAPWMCGSLNAAPAPGH